MSLTKSSVVIIPRKGFDKLEEAANCFLTFESQEQAATNEISLITKLRNK